MDRNFDESRERSNKEFDLQYELDSQRYFITNKNTRIQTEVTINKNTSNNCLSCKRGGSYIYCPIFNEHFADNKNFDETGEKDGCSKFK